MAGFRDDMRANNARLKERMAANKTKAAEPKLKNAALATGGDTPWHKRTWVIVSFVIFLFPVGLFLMWKYAAWRKLVKVLVSALVVIALVLIIVFAPPSVTVKSRLKDIEDEHYTLTGKVSPANATVTVNGKPVARQGDQFMIDLNLSEGDNTVNLEVAKGDKKSKKPVKIHRLTTAELAKRKADEDAKRKAKEAKAKKSEPKQAAAPQPKPEPKKEEPKKPDPKKEQPKPAPKPQAPPSTIHQLWVAADKGVGTRNGVDVKYSNQTKIAELIITRKSDSFWDEKAVVQSAYASFVQWGKEATKVGGVETLDVTLKTDFKDPYGKTSIDDAVQITMQKKDFDKFNWDGLKGQVIAPQLRSSQTNTFGFLIVHPALAKELDKAKLLY